MLSLQQRDPLFISMSNNEENGSIDMDDGDEENLLEVDEEADRACDGDVRAYYDSLTPDNIGNGWFDQRVARIHEGVNITNSRMFHSKPHQSHPSPENIPALHPLRALASVLEQAPAGSTVRVCCYMLTCPVAIDLLIHHGASKTVEIILNPSDQTITRLEEFFAEHGRIARRAFHNRLEVRVADVNGPNCSHYTSFNLNGVFTDLHATCGSYNLTNASNYLNWESLHVADSSPQGVAHFDALWNSWAHRSVGVVYPDLSP